MRHYNTYDEVVRELDKLSTGKEMATLPGGERMRSNEFGDLFEHDIPRLMYGDRLKPATSEDDCKLHIDGYIDGESYDFKAPKHKNGVLAQGEILVEITNVHGEPGWLCGAEMYVMIGYVVDNTFYFLKYDRDRLLSYVVDHYNEIDWVNGRTGRDDEFAWITPPGTEGGFVEAFRIGKYVDQALYERRSAKFKLIEQLNKKRHGN